MTPVLLLVLVVSAGAFEPTPRTPFEPTPRTPFKPTPRNPFKATPRTLVDPTPRNHFRPQSVTLNFVEETPRDVTENGLPTPLIQNDQERPPPPIVYEEKKNPIFSNPEVTENGDKLWEGDMILSQEQEDSLYGPLDTRKGIEDERYRWTNGVVPFTISDSSKGDRKEILAGLQHWMDNSCLKFVEVAAGAQQPHLIFKKLGGCFSSVGMYWWLNGQEISIGQGCNSLGTVAHEVGHAIGFWHEQSRPDRDNHIWIIEDNVEEGKLFNFDKREDTSTYGIPYDFTSIMHYEFTSFSKNKQPTMVPKDVMRTFDIQDKKLSFYDLKMANLMYKCSAKCTSRPACRNQGFVDHNCRCRCPDGYQGSLCERYVGVPAKCGGKFTSEKTITSPNFPNNYPKGSRCIWSFEAPAGKKVSAYFPEFDLIQRHKDSDTCPFDYFEVRGGGYMGNQYCEKELKNMQITSNTNKMDLLFMSNYDWNPGFKVVVSFVPA